MIDQLLNRKFLPKKWMDAVDRRWPPDSRHHILKWLCIIGFVVASFMAFDDVSSRLRSTQQQLLSARHEPNSWPALDPSEAISFREELKKIPPEKITVFCSVPACSALAESIASVFKVLKENGWPDKYSTHNEVERGIEIWCFPQKDSATRKIVDALERSTNGRLKITVKHRDGVPPADQAANINLVIGRLP